MPKKPVGNLANIGHPCINAQETGWQSGKYRSSMHQCSRNWLATGQLFSAGIKCRHCSLLFSTYHKPLVEAVVLCPPVASVQCRVVGEGGHFCCGDITILAGRAQTYRGAAAIFLLLLHKSHGTIWKWNRNLDIIVTFSTIALFCMFIDWKEKYNIIRDTMFRQSCDKRCYIIQGVLLLWPDFGHGNFAYRHFLAYLGYVVRGHVGHVVKVSVT